MSMGVYVALVAAALLACAARAQRDSRYDSRYDYLDVDAILDNRRLVRNYVECLLNRKPCSPEGKALKKILPEALRTKCTRCTERQRRSAVKIIKRLKSDYPEEWSRLAGRWDPNGDFTAYFEHVIANGNNNGLGNNGLIPQATGVPVVNITAPTNLPSLRPVILTGLNEDEDTDKTRPPTPATIAASSVTSRFNTTQRPIRPSDEENTAKTRPTTPATIAVSSVTSRFTTTQDPIRIGSNENTNKDYPVIVSIALSPMTQRPMSTQSSLNRIPERPNGEQPLDGSIEDSSPTQVIFRPVQFPIDEYPDDIISPDNTMTNPLISGTMGIIGHFSNKIIRTTELVTDILRNTVRTIANVG